MKTILLITTILLLSSCSQKHWQSRGFKKGWVDTTTITKHDTIRGFDTTVLRVFDTLTHSDTLFVIKDGVKVKTIIQWKDRIVEQQITKLDTIVKWKTKQTIISDCPKIKWYEWWYIGVIGTLILILLFGILIGYLKK